MMSESQWMMNQRTSEQQTLIHTSSSLDLSSENKLKQ
jgi:hypothetical protein